ncbi:MAG: UbiA family prenyltransferase [Chlorobi bacterium]|nr:UbiA family prenyltransferase [Chlorobiota bacterium]MBX7216344.1 putative 4-hydroxybenzoate polyprenyltransferase [Candidatus Kapabacteria bacterium]
MEVVQRIVTFGRMIKFSHSVFALPFALVSGLIAWATQPVTITPVDILLLLVCMVSARTAAMGFNRLADRDIDAVNPRTHNREIPAGKISVKEARLFTAVAVAVFVAASFGVNTLCGFLSIPLLGLLLGYSLTKRFTLAVHFILGLCLGAAPVGVWFSLTGAFAWPPILLCIGVALWTAGFDIYYSCQDEAFDRANNLQSIPARLGAMPAIRLVRVVHAAAVACFVMFGVTAGVGALFYVGIAGVAAILAWEAWLLRNGDLTKIDLAFFNLNGYVSVLFAVAVLVDVLLR